MKEIKSFKFNNPEDMKVGETVFLGDMDKIEIGFCLGCHPPSEDFIEKYLVGKMIFDKTCDKHTKEYNLS